MKHFGQIALYWASAAIILLALSGCVANHAYRDKEPVLHEFAPETNAESSSPIQPAPADPPADVSRPKYSLAFVEFDDLGEMFTEEGRAYKRDHDAELRQTLDEIRRINAAAIKIPESDPPDLRAYPLFVVFIHGWKNNASDSSGNVWGFRTELQSLARAMSGRPIMGIYFGWRGAVTNIPLVKEFTFWNRKDTATRIPGAHLTEALRRITIEAKSNPKAKCIVVGHSFGGLVMERTLTQAMVEMIVEHQVDSEKISEEAADERLRRKMPDLTVLLNEAGPATEGKEFLNFLASEKVRYFNASNPAEAHPLFLSMTSVGDSATHIIFSAGQFLGKHSLTTRKYEPADEFGETDQSHYFLHTTANSPKLVSHLVGKKPVNEPCPAKFLQFQMGDVCYSISPRPDRSNRTPYWVLQIPTEFVPDHSTIFKPELRQLLGAFLTPPGKTPPQLRLRSESKY